MKKNGFTLVELLVVISIIAILSVIGITIFSSAQKTARDARRRYDLRAISNALEQYKATNGNYPSPGTPGQSGWFCSCAAHTPHRYWDQDPTVSTALAPYFASSLPTDPVNSENQRYCLDFTVDKYFLYVNLEVPPPSPWPIMSGNGCGPGAAQILIRNQQ